VCYTQILNHPGATTEVVSGGFQNFKKSNCAKSDCSFDKRYLKYNRQKDPKIKNFASIIKIKPWHISQKVKNLIKQNVFEYHCVYTYHCRLQ